jgi:DNA/RNA endonuclease G (NUC1)
MYFFLPIKLSLYADYALLHLWPQNNIRIPSFFYYVSYHKTAQANAKANTTLYTIVLYIHQVKILRTHKNIPHTHPITRDSTECRKTTLLIFSYQTTKSNVPEGESVSTSIQLFYHDDDDRKCHGIMMNS